MPDALSELGQRLGWTQPDDTQADWDDPDFREYLRRYGVRNPRDPRHHYDYWAAYKAGVRPVKWSELPEADRAEDVAQGRVGPGKIERDTYMWPDRAPTGESLKTEGHPFLPKGDDTYDMLESMAGRAAQRPKPAAHSGMHLQAGALDRFVTQAELPPAMRDQDPLQNQTLPIRDRTQSNTLLVEKLREYRAAGGAPGDTAMYWLKRLPFTPAGIIDAVQVRRAADRIAKGWGKYGDHEMVAAFLARTEREEDQGLLRTAADIVTALPAFATEFALTGGAYSGVRQAATRGLQRGVGKAAESAAGKVAGGLASRAAGVAAQTAVNPRLVGESTVREMMPTFEMQADERGQLERIVIREGDDFADALPRGFLDAFIEMASERTGGRLGKLAGKLVPARLKAAVARRWLRRNPGKRVKDFMAVVEKTGWHGPAQEWLEERVGDVARSATGLQDWKEVLPSSDWAAEIIAFTVPGAAIAATKKMLLTREGAARFARERPDAADEYANKDLPSREDLRRAGLGAREQWTKDERQALAFLLREARRQQQATAEPETETTPAPTEVSDAEVPQEQARPALPEPGLVSETAPREATAEPVAGAEDAPRDPDGTPLVEVFTGLEGVSVWAYPGREEHVNDLVKEMHKIDPAKQARPRQYRGAAKKPPKATPKRVTATPDRVRAIFAGRSREYSPKFALDTVQVDAGGTRLSTTDGRMLWVQHGQWGQDGIYREGDNRSGKLARPLEREEAKHPRIDDVIPVTAPVEVTAEVQIGGALRRLRQLWPIAKDSENHKVVVVHNADGSLGFVADNPEAGSAELNVQPEHEVLGIADADRLRKSLGWIYANGDDTARLWWPQPETGTVPPLAMRGEQGQTLAVIMPLRPTEDVGVEGGPEEQAEEGAEPEAGAPSVGGEAFAAPHGPGVSDFTARPGTPGGGIADQLQPMELPELVELARQLLGALPRVKRQRGLGTMGVFRHLEDTPVGMIIEIDPQATKDEKYLAQVLAHEIGHLVDFLPDHTMKRGNILGRIASLRSYLSHSIAGKPGGAGPLSQKDRDRLMREARALLEKNAEQEIDEVVRKETSLTPADVLAIWNSVEAGKDSPELLDYIKRLSDAHKKSIVLAALKGTVPAELRRFDKVVTEKTGRKVRRRVEVTREALLQKHRRLIEEEIHKRQLLERDVIARELIQLSAWWRGPLGVGLYRQYRQSSRELYADAVSVLLNTPGELERRAPNFYRGFMAYAERKPQVVEEYVYLQKILAGGSEAVAERRTGAVHDMFAHGREKIRAEREAREAARLSIAENLRQFLEQYILNKNVPITGRAVAAHKRGALTFDEAQNVRFIMDELFDLDSPGHKMLRDVQQNVYQPLLDAKADKLDLGEYLFLRRVIDERNEIANPLGFTPSTAADQLTALRQRLGDERYAAVERAANAFHDLMFAIAERAVETGVYSKRLMEETIRPNKDHYAAFAVIKHLRDRIPASIHRQIGTFQEIANPFDATIMKMWTTLRLIELNHAKATVRDTLQTAFSDEIKPASIPPGAREPGRPPAPGQEHLLILEDGRLHAYEVPDNIAKAFKTHDVGGLRRYAQILQSKVYKIFHPLFVTFAPGFQAHNPFRDLRRTHVNLGADVGASLGEVVAAYWKAAPSALRRARGIDDATINQMMDERALGVPYVNVSSEAGDETGEFERMMQQVGLTDKPESRYKLVRFLKHLLHGVEAVGVFQETAAKVAAWQIYGARGIVGKDRAYRVRKYAGTPDWKQRGLATPITNSVWMYSKVRWNGLQADLSLATKKESAARWWWRRMVWTFAPTSLTKLAMWGAFGPVLKELFDKIPQYFLDNYDVIPLGTEPGGDDGEEKVIFLTLPQDDVGRFLRRAMMQGMDLLREATGDDTRRGSWEQAASELFDTTRGELVPNLNPILDMLGRWSQFAGGLNPYDSYFGQPIVPRTDWEAGGWYAARRMLAWTVNKFGVLSTAAYPFTGPLVGQPFGGEQGEDSTVEVAVRSVPGINRLLRISDRGLSEQEWADLENEERERARFRLELPREVRRLTSERYRLQRRPDQKLGDADRKRLGKLNGWYNEVYLPTTRGIRLAQEAGDAAREQRLRERLVRWTRNRGL